ncbi:MAG TPA: RHS repeat-associated core domain-containing protein, partial [Pyrinomonadaceae bacterium]|nr:RHS repeat-associated core domain-containing protein [Pyrinomonadaceae bacterium]
TDQANKSRRRVADALGRLARMDEPDALGNLGSVGSPTQPTTYEYDALDNLIHITQGVQHRYFKFDSLSRMTFERQPEQAAPHAATDALTGNNNWSRKIEYNGFSLVSQVTDARGVATSFVYDTLNRLTTKSYSDSTAAVQYSYDEARSPEGGGDPSSNRGRLTTVTTGSSGQIYQQFSYNRMGKVAMHRQTPGGNLGELQFFFEIQYSYNLAGQMIEEWLRGLPPNLPPNYLGTYSPDEKRSFFYDAAGRLTSVNRGSHSAPQAAYASSLSYNPAGALESLTYGNGATETKSYNSRMQVTSQSLVKAGTVLQRYDYQYGQVNQSTGAVDAQKNNGQLGRTDGFIGGTPQSPVKQWDERFSYDSFGRLDMASEYRGDTGALSWQTDYEYDRYGNRTSVSGIGYLALSEPPALAGGSSVAIAQSGNPKISLPTEQLTTTDLELPAALRPAAPRSASNSHHAARSAPSNSATVQGGPPVFTDDPLVPGVTPIKAVHITQLRTAINDARTRAALPGANWAESVTAGTTLIKAAHITELRARLDEARAALGMVPASYTNSTLTVGVTAVKAVHLQELRHRVTEALTANVTSYDTSTNRITTAGTTYDAAGQTLTDAIFRGLQYQYNPEGRMIWSANLDGSNPATSVYDGLGQRVQTTQAGVTKSYFYDINGSVVAEYEATSNPGYGYGVLKRLNVSAGGRLLAVDEVQTNGTKVTSYLMGDRQGSTRVLMDAAGAVTSRHDYLPFGEELGAGTGAPGSPTGMRTAAQGYSVADNVRQRYADTRLDDATGLDHTLWRKLETRSGRWTTPDPYGKSLTVANPQSFNRYAYVQNDPVNLVDPSGLKIDVIKIYTSDWKPEGDLLYWRFLFWTPDIGGNEGETPGTQGPSTADPTQDSEPLIRVLPGFDSDREKEMLQTLEDMQRSSKCAEAFANAGLTAIAGLIQHGIVIGPATLLSNPANTQMIGITEHARQREVGAVGSTAIQAFTIRNWPGFIDDTIDSRARIFLNSSAFRGGRHSLREVLAHEFLHVAGWRPEQVGIFGTLTGKTDLSHYAKYDEIMAACK